MADRADLQGSLAVLSARPDEDACCVLPHALVLEKALRIFAASFKRIPFPRPPDVVSAEVATVEELDRQLQESNFPDLVGIAEVAEILGVTKQRASELSRSRRFPKPIAQITAGPVWDRHAIARFVERWPRRRTGRPEKAGAVGGGVPSLP